MTEIMDDYTYGFTACFVEGNKKAFDLLGQIDDFYENNIVCGEDWPEDEIKKFKGEIKAQVNACKYAQVVIQNGKLEDEEELPW